ncbi:hypothetical protein OIV83_003981 [Microbotryomycetes sp. JL201]|nr:hypothetical protein OIV83_003981 [Microbotryomycetes sp. JL201]
MASEVLPPQLAAYKPSQNERDMSKHLFDQADSDQLGVLTGDKAVPFFQHSSLSPALLAQVWQLSDPENTGFLTSERFGVALRLIGHLQNSSNIGPTTQVNENLIGKPGPFPRFNGYPIPSHLGQGVSEPASASSKPNAAPTSGTPSQVQPQSTGNALAGNTVTPEEKARYAKLFANSGPVNGLLDGDKARDIFIKSKLPFDTLGQIWNLADTRSRGALDVTDFTIGMHLIQHTMNGTLPQLPTLLNPALYASAASLPLPNAPAAGATAPGSPAPASRFGAVAAPTMPGTPTRQSSLAPAPPQFTSPQAASSVPWDISAAEKLESDGYFDGIDTQRKGAIEGEAAVGFFMQSGLPMDVLARVWDLADIRQTGSLNKDEFAVALKLIRDRVTGKELPQTLPISLVPPSSRSNLTPTGPQGVQRDLLDLMDDEAPPSTSSMAPAAAPVASQPIGSSQQRALSPPPVANRSLSPQTTGTATPTYALQGTIFPQATGASQQTLSPQTTGFGNNFAPSMPVAGTSAATAAVPAAAAAVAATSSNFFDDNDDADKHAQLSADSAQLGNLQKEHKSVTEAVSNLTMKRDELEKALADTTSQINELQSKLAQARAAHETERQLVDDLVKRNEEQKQMLTRARTELITAESDLSALRVEKTEIEGNFLRDKEDVRDMKKKMAEIAAETKTLRDMIEKMKKDARQQKGLVAISKKQLATAETDKDKTEKELQELEKGGFAADAAEPVTTGLASRSIDGDESPFDFPSSISGAAPALAATAPAAVAAALPLPQSPSVTSPATSVKSTNPFDRISRNLSPQSTGQPSSDQPQSSGSLSLPTAAAAALGTGAVAAAGAAAAGVAGFFSSNDDRGGEGEGSETRQSPHAAEVGMNSTLTSQGQPEVDPFGVPVSQAPADSSTAATPADSTAFDAAFDDGFGDDFAASAATGGAGPSSTQQIDDKAFDDAFGDSPTTVTEPVEQVASESDKRGEEQAIAQPAQQEPTQPDEPPVPAGLGESSAAPPRYDVFNPPTETSEEMTSAGAVTESAPTHENVEADSSDEEDEIEDAGPSKYSARAAETETEAIVGNGHDQQPTTSTSDSGDSFVHVPSSTSAPADDDMTAKLPPVVGEEAPAAHAEARTQSPTSDADNYTDATAGDDHESAPSSPFDAPNTAAPTFEAVSTPTGAEPGTGIAAATLPSPPASHRRAPPPPPSAKSTLSVPPLANAAAVPAATVGDTPASSAFDDSFGSGPFDSPTPVAGNGGPSQGLDDFDAAFADMETSGTSGINATTARPVAASKTLDDSFDTFDNDPDFDFKPDFEDSAAAPQRSSGAGGTAGSAFDDDFANFDESFNPASSVKQQEAVSSVGADQGEEDDAPAVKQITAMGFSRDQAVNALEKSNFDVNKAINSLLA